MASFVLRKKKVLNVRQVLVCMSCSHDDKVDLRLGGTAPESGQADNAKWAYSRPGAEGRPEFQIRNYH